MANVLTKKVGSLRDGFMSWYERTPSYLVVISAILAVLVLAIIFLVLLKIFAPQPKTYEEYFETIEEVRDYDAQASENSGAYLPLDQQLGREEYEREVLGVENDEYESAAQHQLNSMMQVEANNDQARRLGGISTPAELEQYATNNSGSAAASQAVAETIALSQGKDVENALADALYVAPDEVQ